MYIRETSVTDGIEVLGLDKLTRRRVEREYTHLASST